MHHDIIIVGAGMVGAALGVHLAQQTSLKIALVEPQLPSEIYESIPLRVSAISAASQDFLAELGLWQDIAAVPYGHYEAMRVWDAKSRGVIHFDAADMAVAYLGFIVDNRVIQKILWQRLNQLSNISVYVGEQAIGLSKDQDRWILTLSSNKTLSAKLIVGADGVNSFVREHLAIDCLRHSYAQEATVCALKTQKPHQNTAYQIFHPEGPLAFLPLSDPEQCSIVWSNKVDAAQGIKALDDKAFCEAIAEAFEYTLGTVELLSARAHFPLGYHHAKSYVVDGVVLIGDAAHGIHPLAGQGVNLGFMDAKVLAETVMHALSLKRPWHTLANLKAYERERRLHNTLTLQAMNGLNALFSNDKKSLSFIRGLGLNAIDKLLPVKKIFIRQAMGIT